MRFPIRVQLTRRCQRCGLRYPREQMNCPHCRGLTDEQVLKIRARHRRELMGNDQLGRLLFYIAGLLVVLLVIFSLSIH